MCGAFSLSKWDRKAGKRFFWHRIYWKDKWTPFCRLTRREDSLDECYWIYRHGDLEELLTDILPWWEQVLEFIRDICWSMWYSLDEANDNMLTGREPANRVGQRR